MKTTLYMATSANGIIARENGDEDFLSHENWKKFCELANEFGNFIVGRKTYDAVKKWDEGYKILPTQHLKALLSNSATLSALKKLLSHKTHPQN